MFIKYILLILTLLIASLKIYPMQKQSFNDMPIEVKLYILTKNIENIVEDNSVLEPFNRIKDFISSITLVNSELYGLKWDLIKFAKSYVKKFFAYDLLSLTQDVKDNELIDIIKNCSTEETDIQAAKLIISGADPNLIINFEPILNVITKKNKSINLITLLMQYGAIPNKKNRDGNTALILASRYGHKHVLKKLLNCKAIDINVQNNCGYTALMFAIDFRNWKITKLLLKDKNINVSIKDKYGDDALLHAVRDRQLKICTSLLNLKGANVNAKNILGRTSLMVAVSVGSKNMVHLLLSFSDININIQDTYGRTALIIAAMYGYQEILMILLSRKELDLNIKDDQGNNALDIAKICNNKRTVKILNEHLNHGKRYFCNLY